MDTAVLRDDMVDSLEHESKACVESEAISVAQDRSVHTKSSCRTVIISSLVVR